VSEPDVHPSTRIRRMRRADGRCVRCGDLLTGHDRQYSNCRTCRIVLAAWVAKQRAKRKM
jgi:hypothetical protein